MLELLPHVLRLVNQDAAGVEVLEALNKSSGLLVQVWVMKKFVQKVQRELNRLVWKTRDPPMHETVPTSCDEVLVKLNLIYAHICIFFGALFSDLSKIESREQFM